MAVLPRRQGKRGDRDAPRGNFAVRPLRGARSQVGNLFCLHSIQLQEFADNSQACPRKVDVRFAVKFNSY